jgi:hypothetical protein
MWGALLGTADWLSRRAQDRGGVPVSMAVVLEHAIKAY